jgi:hypothetical protein
MATRKPKQKPKQPTPRPVNSSGPHREPKFLEQMVVKHSTAKGVSPHGS